jgi:hypothetical protein
MKKILMIVGLITLVSQLYAGENNNTSVASTGFTVDGLKSGIHLNDILKLKFKKREDGQYSVLQGSTNITTEMLQGKEQSGDFIAYETEILGKKATVYLWLTSKSKVLYTARIEWESLGLDSFKDFYANTSKILSKKYGKGSSEIKNDKKQLTMPGTVWTPDDRIKITMRMSIGASYSMGVYINYLDMLLYKKNKDEMKSFSKTTDKL